MTIVKEYNLKFTKRENIDKKKIIRKFRKFLKELKMKFFDFELKNNSNRQFWLDFINENILPPMRYHDKKTGEHIKFKSFNTNFIVWLFSQKEAAKFYEVFINKQFGKLFDSLTSKYIIQEGEEKEQLELYIKTFAAIYSNYYKSEPAPKEKIISEGSSTQKSVISCETNKYHPTTVKC